MYLIVPIVILLGGLTALVIFGASGTIGGLEAGQFASLVSLSAMAIWIGAGAFHRTAISTTLRNLSLWAGIFLALGVVYTYRFEFEQVKDRFVAALVPGKTVATRNVNGRNSAILTRGSNGSYRVDASLEGEPVNFMVDTGASTIVLTSRTAQAIGIDLDRLRFNQPVSTANGVTTAASARISEMSIGGIRRRNMQALIAQPGSLRQNLLGMNFLNSLTEFSFRGDRLELID